MRYGRRRTERNGKAKTCSRWVITSLSVIQHNKITMALVNYSDSESSDAEVQSVPAPALAPPPKTTAKPNFHKVIDRSEPRKIKIDLPTIQPESSQRNDEERPAKKARTVGAFSGFNSLLPAPKRATATNGPKPGVSLKTSSEAAFSRAPVVAADMGGEQDKGVSGGASDEVVGNADAGLGVGDEKAEAKIVGKATRFKPLSVTNRKRPVKKTKAMEGIDADADGSAAEPSLAHISKQVDEPAPPPPKPKKSLFSVPQDEQLPSEPITETYESMTQHNELPEEPIDSTKHLSQSPTEPIPTQTHYNH